MLTALACILVGDTQNALHLRTAVEVGIISLIRTLLLLTEIHTAGKLTDTDKVSSAYQFILQGRLVHQAVERLNGTYIGKEPQFLTHSQQSLLRPHLSCRVIIELGITDTGKKHSISIHTGLEGFLREGITHLIDSMGTAKSLLIGNLVSELPGNSTHNSYALLHNLWTDTVTGQNCNLKLHILVLLCLTS